MSVPSAEKPRALVKLLAAAVLLLAARDAALASRAAPVQARDPAFGAYWHDGKAEMDGYRYTVTRYGQLRHGQCVAIYVTEPFSRAKRVKVDEPSGNPRDIVDVLKLNLVRDFQTGIYDYNTLTSLYVRSEDFDPVKVSFASTEWCGNVYEELRVDAGIVSQKLWSYFEDESSTQEIRRPKGGILEEELFIRLRGLSGEYLGAGQTRTVPFLPAAFRRRLTHRPLRWTSARIERLEGTRAILVPAGRFMATAYTVEVADGEEGSFYIEDAYPHRVVRWEWRPRQKDRGTSDSNDSGELAGSARLRYWQIHGEGDEKYLRRLGLRPMPR
jgi:hypothetical protein